ncbi:PEP-CTERM sorting domain-containing protein [Anabaena subtropica]|uniref:PEP-CTERM sorting domain-containing protein n=1 Tax=Anabaena subtropica FACHB-260 TaxID=2692884 RepID=A0ABR8CI70_9NOST|nr:PEP-CTERM sorting domain-containing protein [Anabaena subtropica]MBD2342910.1 PEP-CTERM sorting domain-containing protein [Anabaena subtropica FACHB-260]
MKPYLEFAQRFLLLGTTFLASSLLLTTPSRGATLAASEAVLLLTDFSHAPVSNFTRTTGNTTSLSQGGSVVSEGNANAYLGNIPTTGFNFTSSFATGENKDYSGLAESESIIRGIFDIPEKTTFSFNFAANLNLNALTSPPTWGNANTSGEIFFALVDLSTKSTLDFFNVVGSLSTQDDEDFLNYQTIGNVTLNDELTGVNEYLGDNQKFTTAYFDGSVQRYFTNRTSLALVAVNRNQASVSIPEPSTCIGLLISCAVVSIVLKRSRQKTIPTYLSATK